MKKLFTILFLLCLFSGVSAQWKPTAMQGERVGNTSPQEEFFTLDLKQLRAQLANAQESGNYAKPVVISVPVLGGKIEKFNVYSSPVMVKELAAKYQLGSYVGVGVDDKTKIIRFSVAPNDFQSMIMKEGQYEFIEPSNKSKTVYRVYPKNTKGGDKIFVCSTMENPAVKKQMESLYSSGKSFTNNPADFSKNSDKKYRTYRLALSVNGEYTQLFGGVAGALTQMNATMTRVNGVFEKDFALKLIMGNFPQLIYTNPATDPYSNMGNWSNELTNTLIANPGNAAFDIGHLFGDSGGGGMAGCIGCICSNTIGNYKGSGYTSPGSGLPQGDTFDIDYVAHEMGHQLGGNHTFSHNLEGSGSNMEPGSGSTIMGYAGITAQNVQMHSDPYFHARSIAQIQTNVINNPSCGTSTDIPNNPPVIAPLTPYTIPKGTAFVLTANATDPEGDAMTYTWEQYDNATQAITSANLGNTTTGAAFRSVLPGTSPTRYFPRLSSVMNGVLNNSNGLWEAVPTVARTMNFRVTVRDNHVPLTQQQTQFAQQTITAGNDGPFIVTSTTGYNNTPGAVTWDVVNTTNAPYNVANVKIDYTTDNGLTWTTLIASTPNDGSEDVTFTGVATNTNVKVRVSAINNVFYAVKAMNITASALCTGAPPTGITITNVTGNSASVNWTAIAGATYVLQYSVVGSGTWTTIPNITTTTQALTGLAAGTNYIVQVATICSGSTQGAFSPSSNFTTIGPSNLPYVQPFTNYNDLVFNNGTQANKWFYGAAAGNPANSIYISSDNGATNGYNNGATSVVHAYKDLIIPAGSTVSTFSFDWRANGESCCDYLRVWLVPATFNPAPGTQITPSTTPGSVRTQIGGNFNMQTTWQNYQDFALNLAPWAGQTMRLVFEWRNDNSVGTAPSGAIDNINLFIPTCLIPSNLNAALTPTSATLTWTPPTTIPANGYQYIVTTVNTPPAPTAVGTPVTGTSVTIPVTPGTTYYWWVKAICSPTDSSSWAPGTPFTPGQIGSGTLTTGNLPVYSCFGYNYSQQIYTAAEVTGAIGTNTIITKIRFQVDSPAATQDNYNQWVVYMGNTTQNNFATTTSWVPNSQLMQVYSGTLPNMTAGNWVELTLNVPFVWNGTSNIVIAVDENAPNWSCTAQWGGYNAGTNRGILYYSDGTNPNPVSPPAASSRYSIIPKLQLVSEPMPPCTTAPPTYLNVSGLTTTSAFVSWMPAQGATYLLQWRPVTTPATPWPIAIPLTTSFYNITGLTEQTTYEVRVLYVCNGVNGNYTAPLQFTTPALPYCPANPTSTTLDVYISNVTVNSTSAPGMINNSTGGAQYIYYNSAVDPTKLVKFVMGTPNNQISVTKTWPGTQWSTGVGVWIDWNRDGDFSDPGEQIFTSPSNTTATVTSPMFTVPMPPQAYTGSFKTRMRVAAQESGTPAACGTFTWGEVEDYDVELIQPVPCTSAAPTNLAATNLTPTSATLSWMPATGATYILQWREVTTPASAWTTVTPAPTFSYYVLTGLQEQHNYQFQVAYICNGVQGAWATLQFTTPPLQWCPASSTTTPVNEHISNVTVTPVQPPYPILAPMVNNSGASNYTDYYLDTTKRVRLVKGSQGNTISISKFWTGAPSNVAVSVWIDWNRDGDFADPGELILNTPANQTTPVTGIINVPSTTFTSQYPTKMRVIARLTTPPTACGTFNSGEVEDYALELVEPIPCNSASPNATITGITHNSAVINWTADPGGATYIVQYKPLGATNWTAQVPLPALSNTYTLLGLSPATLYTVQVIALCNNVPGTPTELTFTTKCDPAPPTNFTVSQITSTSALVTWDPVATAVYKLRYRKVGALTWEPVINVTGTSYTLTNLLPYTTYEVQVASECSGAINPYTTPEVFTTLPTCEMAPVGLTVTNMTMTSAQVDWNAFPGATYVLRWRKVGASGWNTINVPTNTYIITGLFEETQYEVQVANVCNGGQQAFTHPYVFTTPGLVYCNMSATNSSAEHISNVTVKPTGGPEMSSDSGPSSYTSYLADPTRFIVLQQGSTGNQISISKAWAGTQHNEAVTVWIDFNRNGSFSNNERILIAPANTTSPVTATFNVPADAYASLTNDKYVVMRVAMRRNGSPEMCSTFDNGEVEDYKVRIVKPMPANIMDPNQIIIYPNPTKNILFITKVEDGSKYKIYDSAGRVVQGGSIFSNKIDVSTLINGVFTIDIQAKNGESAQKKFIKE